MPLGLEVRTEQTDGSEVAVRVQSYRDRTRGDVLARVVLLNVSGEIDLAIERVAPLAVSIDGDSKNQ